MNCKVATLLFCITLLSCTEVQNSDSTKGHVANMPLVSSITSVLGKESTIYTTASQTELRLTETGIAAFKAVVQPLENEVSVFVNPNKSFQTLLGIGGAITDASAEVFAQLPLEKQKEFLTAYYHKDKGIGYSLCRITIHSCDFSSGSYTYIEEGDKDLKTFSINHDKTYKIPMIK